MNNVLTDRGDPLLTAWILAWGPRQLVRDPAELFQANIFHPYRDTFAYSEHILGPALLAAPARLFTSNAVAVQNVSFVTAFVSLGVAAFLFLRWITGDSVAAATAGALAAFAPVRWGQLAHIQLLHTAVFLLLLYGLWSWYERNRRSSAWIAAGSLLFLMLSSFYLAAMALVTVAVLVLVAPLPFGLRRASNSALRIAPWILGACAAAIPFAIPYWRLAREMGFVRDLERNWINWASHKDYMRPLAGSLAAKLFPAYATPRGRCLYLGLVTVALAAGAMLLLFSRREERSGRHRAAAVLLGALALAAFLVSLGGWRWIGGDRLLLPFYYLHQLPGFSGIRAPIRFGILADLAVVALAALGLARLRRALSLRVGAVPSGFFALAIGGLAFAERTPPLPMRPLESIEVGDQIPHVYRLLADEKRPVRVLLLPMTGARREREPWDVVPYKHVYFSTVHWKRMLNGSSGYRPPGFDELEARTARFPSADALEDLRALPIDRVVVDRTLLAEPAPAALFRRDGFRVVHDCPDDLVVEVEPRPAPPPERRAPRVEVLEEPARGRPLRVALSWDPALPDLLYPPPRTEVLFEAVDGRGEIRSTTRLVYPAEPRLARIFTAAAPPTARALRLEIRTEEKQTTAMRWELPDTPGGTP
ncbi:MAG: hypothetical protein ABR576_00740 [Thermoanaerobaculia bacterium]